MIMGVGRECNFCDFVDEVSRVSQGVYPFFQIHKTSHDRASPYTVLTMGQILLNCHTHLC